MRERTTKQKNLIIGGLLAIVFLMAVGYAAFATQLNITGTASFDNTWCIGFDSRNTSAYQATAGVSGGTVPTGSISFDGNTCATNYKTDASLTAAFKQPGDKIVYTLTIANKSTLTAAIKSIKVEDESVTSNKTITKGNVKYTVEMPESTTLAANATTTMKVTAEFQNDTDINKYTTGETQTIDVEINAQQDDGNGGMVVQNGFTGSIYRYNSSGLNIRIGDSITGKEMWCAGGYYCYSTEESCLNKKPPFAQSCELTTQDLGEYTTDASTLNKTFYLKHDVVNDIITASYVCFIYGKPNYILSSNEETPADRSGQEACLKGGDEGAAFDENTQILKDFQAYYNLNTVDNPSSSNPGCTFNSSYSSCSGGGFNSMSVYNYGSVNVYGSSSGNCNISSASSSNCDG